MFSLNHEHDIWATFFVTWNFDPRCFGLHRFGLALCVVCRLMTGARPNSDRGVLGLALYVVGGLMTGARPNSGRGVLGLNFGL